MGDGALKNKKSRNEGHRAGLNTIENILKETIKQKLSLLLCLLFLPKTGIDQKKK